MSSNRKPEQLTLNLTPEFGHPPMKLSVVSFADQQQSSADPMRSKRVICPRGPRGKVLKHLQFPVTEDIDEFLKNQTMGASVQVLLALARLGISVLRENACTLYVDFEE